MVTGDTGSALRTPCVYLLVWLRETGDLRARVQLCILHRSNSMALGTTKNLLSFLTVMSPPGKSPQYVGLQIVTRMEQAGTRGRSLDSAPGQRGEPQEQAGGLLSLCNPVPPAGQNLSKSGLCIHRGHLPPSTPPLLRAWDSVFYYEHLSLILPLESLDKK